MLSLTRSVREDLNCFFIVGAPRAGTTAMGHYLKKHPAICFSDPKETHFFFAADDSTEPEDLKRRYLKAFFPTSRNGPPGTLGPDKTLPSLRAACKPSRPIRSDCRV